jgi:hypothetical protein
MERNDLIRENGGDQLRHFKDPAWKLVLIRTYPVHVLAMMRPGKFSTCMHVALSLSESCNVKLQIIFEV